MRTLAKFEQKLIGGGARRYTNSGRYEALLNALEKQVVTGQSFSQSDISKINNAHNRAERQRIANARVRHGGGGFR